MYITAVGEDKEHDIDYYSRLQLFIFNPKPCKAVHFAKFLLRSARSSFSPNLRKDILVIVFL